MSRLRPLWPHLAIAFFALFAAQPLARTQLICSNDALFHITRAVTLDQTIQTGHFFPRWIPQMAHGYGFPFYNYYAPLTYYLFVGLHHLGLIYPAALHVFLGLCVWLAGEGMYLFVREWWGPSAGLVAAVVYLMAAYLATNILFRAALAETFALVWPPFVLFTLHRALTHPRHFTRTAHPSIPSSLLPISIWDGLAALSFAGMMLTHNITSLAVLPLVAGYVVVLAFMHPNRGRSIILRGGLIIVLGLALSAHLWLPALAESHLIQSDRLRLIPFSDYYLTWPELLAPPIVADPSLINPSPAMGPGLLPSLLALAGFASIVYRSFTSRPRSTLDSPSLISVNQLRSLLFPVFLILALIGYEFLILPTSRFLWDHVPLLSSVQFPWRFLGPATICVSVLAGGCVQGLPRRQPPFAAAIILVATLGQLAWWYPRYCSPFSETTLAHTVQFEYDTDTLGTMAKSEFLPATVHEFPADNAVAQTLIHNQSPNYLTQLPAEAQLTVTQPDPLDYAATITSSTSFTATFNQFYFPGWRAMVDDHPTPLQPAPDTGLITISVPPGTHTLHFYFGNTPIRTLGDSISLATALLLLGLFASALYSFQSSPALPPTSAPSQPGLAWMPALALTLVLLRFFSIDRFPNPLRHSAFDGQSVAGIKTPMRADFAGGVRLYGYDLSATRLPADGAFEALLYASAPEHIARRYWPAFTIEDDAGLTWIDPDYFPPHWHREPPATSLWPPETYAQWARRIQLLPGAPPGTYQLFGWVFDLDSLQMASLLDEQGNAVAPRFPMGPLTLTRPARPFTLQLEHESLKNFGPLTLLGYNVSAAEAQAGESFLLTLYWKSEAATGTDYTARVDFLTPDGISAFGIDLPPANAYPTSQWQPGDQWRGQQRLRLPATLADGDYELSVSVKGEPGTQVLRRLKVTAPPRTFTRPVFQHESSAKFEGVATLVGYNLLREGNTLTATLVWQATDSPTLSYAVFVHLADETGRVWAQSDSVPVNWTRPTTGWVPGEYLTDAHALTLPTNLPPGEYRLWVGLYDPQTGNRVPAMGAGASADNRVEIGSVSLPESTSSQ